MLDKEQKAKIMKLYGRGVSISEISRNLEVSREIVRRVIETTAGGVIDGLLSRALALWHMSPPLRDEPPFCVYCGEKMKYVERKEPSGEVPPVCRCPGCRRVFSLP